ncbi:hypothetical protein LDENG_00194810 [Lucifuga dentata]|nr:hypothetical protein LDENG_00194810 [Lucifuga dentata]
MGAPLALLWGGRSGGVAWPALLLVCFGGACGCPSWLLGSSIVLVLLCPPGALRPGCLSVWGVPPSRVASVGLREVPVIW